MKKRGSEMSVKNTRNEAESDALAMSATSLACSASASACFLLALGDDGSCDAPHHQSGHDKPTWCTIVILHRESAARSYVGGHRWRTHSEMQRDEVRNAEKAQ